MRRVPVIYRPGAHSDLDGIFDYLLEQGASIRAARSFVGRIESQCGRIGEVPAGYPARPEFGENIRLAPFEHSAVIVYRLTDDAVEILRIYYGGRNYQQIMRDRPGD